MSVRLFVHLRNCVSGSVSESFHPSVPVSEFLCLSLYVFMYCLSISVSVFLNFSLSPAVSVLSACFCPCSCLFMQPYVHLSL